VPGLPAPTTCAFRFSQPPDAFFRPRPLGLVSCRIRPWGLSSQRLPPPGSRHDFRRALSPGQERNLYESLSLTPGLVHPGGPFSAGRCYPHPPADPLSAFSPSEEFTLSLDPGL
jgi:hypothetical protein